MKEVYLLFFLELAAKELLVELLGESRLSFFIILKQVDDLDLLVILDHAFKVLGKGRLCHF